VDSARLGPSSNLFNFDPDKLGLT